MKSYITLLTLVLFIDIAYSQETESLIKMSIFFGGGSSYVDDEQRLELKEFIENLENLEQYKIVLYSHTDNIGSKEYNERLSNMRSTAVLKEILITGVPEEKTEVKDFGLTNPLYMNNSANGRIMNRRVDVILIPIVL
jgi:outer membrane protein OmpA-like peptidoglycan-associated protein